MDVRIEPAVGGQHVIFTAPFHPEWAKPAGLIGGRWQATKRNWCFDARDEQRLRELARDVYGTDGGPCATVTIQAKLDHRDIDTDVASLFFAGREVATRPSRDQRVRLGKGVILVEGGFDTRGGSVRNPTLDAQKGTILEIRDVPAGHRHVTHPAATIVGMDVDALHAERTRLLARLAEIDTALHISRLNISRLNSG